MPDNSTLSLVQYFARNGKSEQVGVAKLIERNVKFMPKLPVRPVKDVVFNFGKETSLGDVEERLVNQSPPKDTKPGVVSPATENLMILYRKVKTDTVLHEGNVQAARTDEIARGTRALSRRIEDLIVNGAKVNADSLDGLRGRVTAAQTIEAGENGDDYSIELLEDALDRVEDQGAGKIVLMNKPTFRAHARLVRAAAGGATVADVTGKVATYEGADMFVLGDKLDDTPVLDFDEAQGTDDETCSFYVVAPGGGDSELSGVRMLMTPGGIKVINEGVRDLFHIDYVQVVFGMVHFYDSSIARVKGIKKPAAT